MMRSNHGAWGTGDWLAMGLMMIVFWGLLIAMAVWVVRRFRVDSVRPGQRPWGSRR